ncbi:MAG TPA: Ig-like domain-containing protein, partial [Myxococcales bacterium]|nr:Ig-like domain-containing protein [Myxococcales bacterium]
MAVTAVWPVTPLHAGATTADLAFDVAGASDQIVIAANGTSISNGLFSTVVNLVVNRDRSGPIPFRAQLPLLIAYPADGVLQVTAVAVAADGTQGAPFAARFDPAAGTPAFSGAMTVQADPAGGALLLQTGTSGPVAQAQASIVLLSAQQLRAVGGDLGKAQSSAIINVSGLSARPSASAPNQISFSIPVDLSQLPADGVVIADLTLTDPFGRTVHDSAVEFTGAAEFDSLVGISVQPSSVALTQGFGQRVPLQTTARFAVAGPVLLNQNGAGILYTSGNTDIVGTSALGDVIARQNGETDVTVSYGGLSTTVHVVVDSNATLDHLELTPAAPVISHVGGTVQLHLDGVLSTGIRPDLTSAGAGTLWSSSDKTVLVVSADGLVTSRRPGSAVITAQNGPQTIAVRVEALDAPPTVSLIAPATVAAGTAFVVAAQAADDVGLDHVQFLVDGVPTLSLSAPPYTLRIQAPPFGGQTMKLAAVAFDTAGQSTRSADAIISVSGAAADSSTPVVYDNPQPGAVLIEGLTVVLRVTSGDWTTGNLSSGDFQQVTFTAGGVAIGTTAIPRMEPRQLTVTDDSGNPKQITIYVPLWELAWTPPAGSGGTSAVVRADGVDAFGAISHGAALLLRIASPGAPLVTIQSPAGAQADATEGVPLNVSGTVGDVALALGANVSLLVDGTAVATAAIRGSLGGALAGSAPFSLAWTPAHAQSGKTVHVEVSATDASGLNTRVGFQALVRPLSPPQVAVLTPGDLSSAIAGQVITLTASVLAARQDGLIVTWVADGAPVGIATAPPYAVSYTVPVSAAGRSLRIEADAQDVNGQRGLNFVTLNAIADHNPPSVSIVTPRDGIDVADSQDLLVTIAGLDDVDAASVDVLLDGNPVTGTTKPTRNSGVPGSFIAHSLISASALAGSPTHRIGARATDPSGNVGVAPEITVHTHVDSPPTVSFSRPAAGSQITEKTTVEVLVNAQDDVAVSKVELVVNGVSAGVATRSPFLFRIPAGNGAPGGTPLLLHAIATDSSSQTSAADLTLSVVPDTQAPLVGFRSPQDGAHVFAGRTLSVQVLATDDVSVASVELFANGVSQGPLTNGVVDGLYRVFTWTVPVPAGAAGTSLSLQAVAKDGSGNAGQRTITVQVVQDQPPVISISAPAANQSAREGDDVQMTYLLNDDDGVTAAVTRSGGINAGPLTPGALLPLGVPRSATVRAPLISLGQPNTVGVAAIDTAGQQTIAEVPLTVSRDTEPPTISMSLPVVPSNGPLTVNQNGSLTARADVGDNVRVVRVSVLLDGVELPEPGQGPRLTPFSEQFVQTSIPNPNAPGQILLDRRYAGSWGGAVSFAGVAVGAHKLALIAYDGPQNHTASASIDFQIVAVVDRDPPHITISLQGTPGDGTTVAGSQINAVLQANDDGIVQSLTLSVDGAPQALPVYSPAQSLTVSVPVLVPA